MRTSPFDDSLVPQSAGVAGSVVGGAPAGGKPIGLALAP